MSQGPLWLEINNAMPGNSRGSVISKTLALGTKPEYKVS